MSDSLRDQLLKAGLQPKRKPDAGSQARHGERGTPPKKEHARTQAEIDLARAYALRQQAEREEQERKRREAEAQARERKERKRKLRELLDGKACNRVDADVARHFEYGGKIKRVYVTAEQLAQVNAGSLGVIMLEGRFVLVERALTLQAQAIAPDAVALLADPDALAREDDVPDDLVW